MFGWVGGGWGEWKQALDTNYYGLARINQTGSANCREFRMGTASKKNRGGREEEQGKTSLYYVHTPDGYIGGLYTPGYQSYNGSSPDIRLQPTMAHTTLPTHTRPMSSYRHNTYLLQLD